jgi:hypothetical protein
MNSYRIPFTSGSSLTAGLHVSAALGGGSAHTFLVDTGSVGILVPRKILGPDYQDFDPSQDIEFGYVSSGNSYWGQWVKVPVLLGTGDGAMANIEVFAVDRPADFDGGVFGVGFAIGGKADGGPARNPLLHLNYKGAHLGHGYIISTLGIDVGLTSVNMQGFDFVDLEREASGADWMQPQGRVGLTGHFSAKGFHADLPFLLDTGIEQMILWTSAGNAPANLPKDTAFPAGIKVSVAARPALEYSFVTGEATQAMAPSYVEWRVGNGINTGRNVLAGADYLYDAAKGRVGFRVR